MPRSTRATSPPGHNVAKASASPTVGVEAVRALARLARLLERASGELNLAHYRVLVAIGAGDARATRVAAKLSLGKPAVSASVDILARRGLITRSAVGGDQRAVALALTAKGRATLKRVEAVMLEQLTSLLGRVDDDAAVLAALGTLGGALDAAAEERWSQQAGRQSTGSK